MAIDTGQLNESNKTSMFQSQGIQLEKFDEETR